MFGWKQITILIGWRGFVNFVTYRRWKPSHTSSSDAWSTMRFAGTFIAYSEAPRAWPASLHTLTSDAWLSTSKITDFFRVLSARQGTKRTTDRSIDHNSISVRFRESHPTKPHQLSKTRYHPPSKGCPKSSRQQWLQSKSNSSSGQPTLTSFLQSFSRRTSSSQLIVKMYQSFNYPDFTFTFLIALYFLLL